MMRIIPNATWYGFSATWRWCLRRWRAWGTERLSTNDLRRCYDYALLDMASMPRTVFLLHCLDELPYPEIADRLQINVTSVEHHLAEALKRDWTNAWPDDP